MQDSVSDQLTACAKIILPKSIEINNRYYSRKTSPKHINRIHDGSYQLRRNAKDNYYEATEMQNELIGVVAIIKHRITMVCGMSGVLR